MYDVIVVGAGPAGSAAAYHATRLGLRALLIERMPFPRPKTCGDALSPRAVAAIRRMHLATLPGAIVRGMSLAHADESSVHFHDFSGDAGAGRGVVIPRTKLDAILLDRARDVGSEFLVGTVERLIQRDGRVWGVGVVDRDGRAVEVASRFVVAAAGASGLTRLMGPGKKSGPALWGVAARTYLRTHSRFGDTLEIRVPIGHRADTLFGYGWVFPVDDRLVNVGVGFACTSRGMPIRRVTETFIADRIARDRRLAGATVTAPISVAPVAVGPRLDTVAGLIAVGDAAGLVNPFTGEGIAAALESGELAAQVLAEGGDEVTYQATLRAGFEGRFRLRSSLRSLYLQGPAMLQRCWDVFASHGIAGSALSAMCWDVERGNGSASTSALTRMVRDEICLGVGRYRPMLAEVVRHALNDPRVQFGRITGALPASIVPASRTLRTVLVAIEGANVVEQLHAEMERGGRATWGSNTARLMVADCLTALVLRSLHHLDASLAREITSVLAGRFRLAARETSLISSGPPGGDALLDLALRVATDADSCGC